jgi:hypothetical protein
MCPGCKGTRLVVEHLTVREGVRIACHYADLIRALPGVQLLLTSEDAIREPHLRFAFHGGDGVVLGLID